MSPTLQFLWSGKGGAEHLRWAFDPTLPFPDGGFDVYRRGSASVAQWLQLKYHFLAQGQTIPPPIASQGWTITHEPPSTTGATPQIMDVNGDAALFWGNGDLRFDLKPAAPRLAVWVGHFFEGAITLRAYSAGGAVEVRMVNPPKGTPTRVEFSGADIFKVTIDGVEVFVTMWEILLGPQATTSWGTPLNGATPIRLPRSDTQANLVVDVSGRITAAEAADVFGAPTDAEAVEELRQLVAAAQPDVARPSGPLELTYTDADGSVTSVDPEAMLRVLALRSVMARALGLYFVDTTAASGTQYDYRVVGHWGGGSPPWAQVGDVAAEVYNVTVDVVNAPPPIVSASATEFLASVRNPLSPEGRPVLVPMKGAQLSWSVPFRSVDDLIDYDSNLYLIERQPLGLLVPPDSTPPAPTAAAWVTLNADAPQFVGHDETGAIETPMYQDVSTSIDAPFEGWYAYQVRGVNVFDLISPPSPTATILQLDDIAPAVPRGVAGPDVRMDVGSDLTVSWSWGPDEALSSPDATTFRVYLNDRDPTLLSFLTGTVSVTVDTGEAVVPLTGDALPIDAATSVVGSRLEVDGVSHLIKGATAGGLQQVIVALSGIDSPASDRPATISYVAAPTDEYNSRVAVVNVAGHVAGTGTGAARNAEGDRVTLTIGPAAAAGVGAVIYDRDSGIAFVVEVPPDAAGVATLVTPPDFELTEPLPGANLLVFPRQSATIADPFAAGVPLRYGDVSVTAADARSYRPDRITSGPLSNAPGNESAPAERVTILVVDPTPPAQPGVGTDPDGPNVYASVPDFHSRSYYELQWAPVAGMRYQVFRALDKTVFEADRKRGGARAYQDDQYAKLTNRELADLAGQLSDIYTIRTKNPVATGSFRDELPGSGPNRFVYCIASVNAAGIRSSLSPPWAPVWIPDTIPPSTPVFKNATVSDGSVTLRWTQPNESLISAFNVYRTEIEAKTIDVRLMGSPRSVLPVVLPHVDGAVEFVDIDVADGIRYFYRIAAVRTVTQPVRVDLESGPSRTIAVKAFSSAPPTSPHISSAVFDVMTMKATLAWTQPSAARAFVQRQLDGTGWRTAAALDRDATTYVDDLSGEVGRTTAAYRIKVMTASGRNSTSAPVELVLV